MKINKLNNRGIAINIIKKNTEKNIFKKKAAFETNTQSN